MSEAGLFHEIVDPGAPRVEMMRAWFAPLRPALFRTAVALTGNSADADRLMTRVRLQGWQSLDGSEDAATIRFRLLRFIIEESLAVLRGRVGDLAGWLDDEPSPEINEPSLPWMTHREDLVFAGECQVIMPLALDSLVPLDRMVFLLLGELEFSVEYTAALLATSPALVKARQNRARLRLREWFKPLRREAMMEWKAAARPLGCTNLR